MADLIEQDELIDYLASQTLSTTETALLPTLASAASRAIRRYCNRHFNRQQWDEIYSVPPPANNLILRQFPVVSVERVATGPTTAIQIGNVDSTTHYRATVQVTATGEAETGLTPTALSLTRYAAGVGTTETVQITGSAISTVVTAINALGNGWEAEAGSGMDGWAATDLRPVQGVFPALAPASAELAIHASDLSFSLDERAGVIYLGRPDTTGFDSPRFGPFWSSQINDVQSYGGALGLRVVYTAGETTVPADVQQACAETVWAAVARSRMDPTLKSESDGTLSWTAVDQIVAIPPGARALLAPWVSHRI
jgi:hypothetical protein